MANARECSAEQTCGDGPDLEALGLSALFGNRDQTQRQKLALERGWEIGMRKLDHTLHAFTQDNPGGPVIQYVDDETAPIELSTDTAGNPTRAGMIGYAIAYAIAFGAATYFLLM